jgi:general secretion pathway protein G
MINRLKDDYQERRASGEGGFTLIELLVVIVILGILAAVVVFAVGGVGDKGQSASCVIDTRTVRTAEEANVASGTVPTNPGFYTTEANLVTNGLLSQQSTYHNVVASAVAGTTGGLTDLGTGATGFAVTVESSKCGNPGLVTPGQPNGIVNVTNGNL